jgi:hypothetical protein
MQLIALADVMKLMRKVDGKGIPVPFSLEVCTYNRFTREGGERLKMDNVILYQQKHVKKPVTDRTKFPNHHDNGTRNVMFVSSGQIRKIHVRLIEKFNGKAVFH